MARYLTANEILKRVAVEVGLGVDNDPYASQNTIYVQLRELLDVAGQELVELHEWSELRKPFTINTVANQQLYNLPDDYAYMINQTGWDRTNELPIGGPLSAQTWTYLLGRNLVNQTIYASFRLAGDVVELFPNPPPSGLDINFEYITNTWVEEPGTGNRFDHVKSGKDIVLYDSILIRRYLKAKHLDAKGFDASTAFNDFETIFNARTGRDQGARILSAGNNNRGFPLIHPYRNTGDTGYGVP